MNKRWNPGAGFCLAVVVSLILWAIIGQLLYWLL